MLFVGSQVRVRITISRHLTSMFLLYICVWSWTRSNPSSCLTSVWIQRFVRNVRKLRDSVQNVHLEMFVSSGASLGRISIQTDRWVHGTDRGVAALWVIPHVTFTILSLTLQASPPTCLTVGRLQLSGGGRECEEVFQREEGWNPVLSAAVPCCPQQPGSTMWARDDRAG